MQKRSILRVQLSAEAKQQLDQLCLQRGMTQIAALSRLVSWFVKQEEVIQLTVLGVLSESSASVLAKELLGRITRGQGMHPGVIDDPEILEK